MQRWRHVGSWRPGVCHGCAEDVTAPSQREAALPGGQSAAWGAGVGHGRDGTPEHGLHGFQAGDLEPGAKGEVGAPPTLVLVGSVNSWSLEAAVLSHSFVARSLPGHVWEHECAVQLDSTGSLEFQVISKEAGWEWCLHPATQQSKLVRDDPSSVDVALSLLEEADERSFWISDRKDASIVVKVQLSLKEFHVSYTWASQAALGHPLADAGSSTRWVTVAWPFCPIRDVPSLTGKPIAALNYGDHVEFEHVPNQGPVTPQDFVQDAYLKCWKLGTSGERLLSGWVMCESNQGVHFVPLQEETKDSVLDPKKLAAAAVEKEGDFEAGLVARRNQRLNLLPRCRFPSTNFPPQVVERLLLNSWRSHPHARTSGFKHATICDVTVARAGADGTSIGIGTAISDWLQIAFNIEAERVTAPAFRRALAGQAVRDDCMAILVVQDPHAWALSALNGTGSKKVPVRWKKAKSGAELEHISDGLPAQDSMEHLLRMPLVWNNTVYVDGIMCAWAWTIHDTACAMASGEISNTFLLRVEDFLFRTEALFHTLERLGLQRRSRPSAKCPNPMLPLTCGLGTKIVEEHLSYLSLPSIQSRQATLIAHQTSEVRAAVGYGDEDEAQKWASSARSQLSELRIEGLQINLGMHPAALGRARSRTRTRVAGGGGGGDDNDSDGSGSEASSDSTRAWTTLTGTTAAFDADATEQAGSSYVGRSAEGSSTTSDDDGGYSLKEDEAVRLSRAPAESPWEDHARHFGTSSRPPGAATGDGGLALEEALRALAPAGAPVSLASVETAHASVAAGPAVVKPMLPAEARVFGWAPAVEFLQVPDGSLRARAARVAERMGAAEQELRDAAREPPERGRGDAEPPDQEIEVTRHDEERQRITPQYHNWKTDVAHKHIMDRLELREKNEAKKLPGMDDYPGDPNGPLQTGRTLFSTRGGHNVEGDYVQLFAPTFDMRLVRDYCTASVLALAHSCNCLWGRLGPDASVDEPRIRCWVAQSNLPTLLIEFNSPQTFNMMDPALTSDLNCLFDSVAQYQTSRKLTSGKSAFTYLLTGNGAHFCPGGNPNALVEPGSTPMTFHQYNISRPFVRFRELSIPGATALHGALVGGGVAVSMNTTWRIGAGSMSVAFGNLSRGAVPCMDLSRNLSGAVGLTSAIDLYLTDGTVSAKGALDRGFLRGVVPTVIDTKHYAFKLSTKLAAMPHCKKLPLIEKNPPVNVARYSQESYSMTFAAKAGEQFANVKEPSRGEASQVMASEGTEAEAAEEGERPAAPHWDAGGGGWQGEDWWGEWTPWGSWGEYGQWQESWPQQQWWEGGAWEQQPATASGTRPADELFEFLSRDKGDE